MSDGEAVGLVTLRRQSRGQIDELVKGMSGIQGKWWPAAAKRKKNQTKPKWLSVKEEKIIKNKNKI